MPNSLRTFFDHSRHKLVVKRLDAPLDVLAFEGEERLSQLSTYRIEFTSPERDINVEQVLNRDASFSLHAVPQPLPYRGAPIPEIKPLRVIHGVVTGFKRLSGSKDEARYELTLQPRLALLGRGKQFRLYQHQSVPQIVESILRKRHALEGQDFLFHLHREYPRRLQVMQYDESDLAFINRLLAEVGIWYRFTSDERLKIDVVEFHDDQRAYQFGVELPCNPPSGLSSSDQDSVWHLQSSHQVVEQHINIRAYDHLNANAWLDGEVDQTRGTTATTYGEAYHYAEPYTVLGSPIDQDEDLQSESGFFYARLRHERYLNDQTQLSGISSSATLVPGQVLTITGGAPQAFVPRVVITQLSTRAARDRTFEACFTAIPYSQTVCFRPPLEPKPQIAGTLAARVTSRSKNDIYSEIDMQGHYKVNFLFDRDPWPTGEESRWLRLARPYGGDTHGLHLPLICGTEVAIAFEQGDPDRPYIAHALHDSQHPDPITLSNNDYKRNVLRTPANNKLRMEDERGREHVKLSTDHSGKSQLNLGHLVDAKKKKRGEGFELRTDGHGAIRAGKGLFISAEQQTKAQGQVLEMSAAVTRLKQAGEQLQSLSTDAQAANAEPADVHAQLTLLREQLDELKASVLLLSAPQGIALTSGQHLQLAAQHNLMLNAGGAADLSVVKRLFIGVGQGLSLFVRKLGIKLIANQGPVTVQAQNDTLELLARQGLSITSSEDEIHITAKKKITLNAGGSYITLDANKIESGTVGDHLVKSADFDYRPKATQAAQLPPLPAVIDPPLRFDEQFRLFASDGERALAGSRYTITSESGKVWKGTSDSQGFTQRVYTATPEKLSLAFDLEEEEEEEELDGITLRLGLFFDGTGNSMANTAATEQCRREDLELFDEGDLKSLIRACNQHGFDEFDGRDFNRVPSNSYGSAPSNVVHLYDLYPDHATDALRPGAEMGYVKVYLEGIGTNNGGSDSWFGLGSGRGGTGVVARVAKAVGLIEKQLESFQRKNPDSSIRRIEFDIFGFSRGAAAARHCTNELLKPRRGLFRELLQGGHSGLLKSFDPAVDVSLNLIGLFDTVAGMIGLDLSPANDINTGVNLYLPPGCAKAVIQLQARDERRNNFAFNSLLSGHRQINLPGVHSDIGGGYLPHARERLWVSKPQMINVPTGRRVESAPEWAAAQARVKAMRENGLAGDGSIELKAWSAGQAPKGKLEPAVHAYWLVIVLDRPMRGELALVALRLMRELGVRHGVPFKSLEGRSELALPQELQPIAEQILEQALAGGNEIKLGPDQECLLRSRYIHRSAHWTPSWGVMLSKPATDNIRNVYPDRPQKGYPE